MPSLDSAEKQRIQRSNQIFLRLRKELHDRDAQFAEKDVREAAQSARWLREIAEQYAGDWEQTYEDALAESELTEEDEAYLQSGVKEAGGSRRSSGATYEDWRKLLPMTRRLVTRLRECLTKTLCAV
jgi:hypothetical protein